jgi:hypothetical protein
MTVSAAAGCPTRVRVPRSLAWIIKVYLDLCCLTASSLRYRLLTDPTCITIGIDLHRPDYIEGLVAGALGAYCPRFRYEKRDAGSLTLDEVRQIVADLARQPMSSVAGVHASPNCRASSFAKRKVGPPHRAMGDPSLYTVDQLEAMDPAAVDQLVAPVSAEAVFDDATRRNMLALLQELTAECPHATVTVENPRSLFRFMPDVRRMAAMPGWQLVSLDYCAVAVAGSDDDTPHVV